MQCLKRYFHIRRLLKDSIMTSACYYISSNSICNAVEPIVFTSEHHKNAPLFDSFHNEFEKIKTEKMRERNFIAMN